MSEKMDNKYEVFRENMNKLVHETNFHDCKTLISLSQNYYSRYCQFKNLDKVKRKLSDIYTFSIEEEGNMKINRKEGKLDIRHRLFVDFYFNSCPKEIRGRKGKYGWLKNSRDVLREWEEEFHISQFILGKKNLYQWIEKSCALAKKMYGKSKSIELGMKNIREAVCLYDDNKKLIQKSEEESFNNVFSEEYVNVLISIMNMNENILCFYIAPIRAQLCTSKQGNKAIDNHTWKWCFEKDYNFSIDELNEKISYIKRYDQIINEFKFFDKKLKEKEVEMGMGNMEADIFEDW